MDVTTCGIVWLCWLLRDICVISQPTTLHCDNNIVMHIAVNSVFHERIEYIGINCHVTRYHFQLRTISMPYVPLAL